MLTRGLLIVDVLRNPSTDYIDQLPGKVPLPAKQATEYSLG